MNLLVFRYQDSARMYPYLRFRDNQSNAVILNGPMIYQVSNGLGRVSAHLKTSPYPVHLQ